MSVTVEICVGSVRSAIEAERGGADRVELCADMAVDGLTPRRDEAARACRVLTIPVHVLIRPRPGDFVYSDDDFEAMCREVVAMKRLRAAGVVVGVSRPGGEIDRERTAELVGLARPLSVTFHKAFDRAPQPFAALDELIALGVDRVLTSGRAPTASEGSHLIDALARQAGGRIAVMAGGRITEHNVGSLLLSSGSLREVHAGTGVMTGGETDAARVARLIERARAVDAPFRGPP
jgi:copper homeostasis protein